MHIIVMIMVASYVSYTRAVINWESGTFRPIMIVSAFIPFTPTLHGRIRICLYWYLLADVTVKTVSEEYTPLHLAARFIPQKTTVTCANSTAGSLRVVPDSDEDGNTVINYLKECKGVDVSPVECCYSGNINRTCMIICRLIIII